MTGFGHDGWIWVLALVALFALALYRRGRRMIGRQRYSEKRVRLRVLFIAVITVLAVISLAQRGPAGVDLGSAAAGFLVGALVAAVALRFTQMGRDERGLWFVPNLYLGIGLVVLLVARFIYEYVEVLPNIREQAAAAAQGATTHVIVAQPMLHGVLFVVLGYYLVYYGGVMLRARRMPAAVAETPAGENGE